MKKIAMFVALVLFMLACGTTQPDLSAIQTAIAMTKTVWTKVPSQTAYPTLTSYPTLTPYPTQTEWIITKLVIVTVTPTLTPEFTPTITNTPAPTFTTTATNDPLKKSRGDGFYLVGKSIAPGVWKSNGTGSSCYWAVTTATGDIIDNHFGMAGGTAYIPASGFQVEFKGCGVWSWMQP